MSDVCRIIPLIEVNGEERESKLFKDLLSFTHDRSNTIELWKMAQDKELMSTYDLEYDENGEPTLESLKKALDLNKVLDINKSVEEVSKELNARDAEGNPVVHTNVQGAIDSVVEMNKNNPNVVANITVSEKGAIIDVSEKDAENANMPEEVEFGSELNKKLLGILNSLGFTVSYDFSGRYEALFSPQSATENAEGLKNVIRVAKGEIGEEKFPEEFAHLMIEGLQRNDLVQRLLNSISDIDTIKAVLGDDYQRYVDLYNGDFDKLQKEAAGNLLGAFIKNHKRPIDRTPLLSRIWNFVKDLFYKSNEDIVNDAIKEAQEIAYKVSDDILNDKLTEEVDKEAVSIAEDLYNVANDLRSTLAFLERSIEVTARRMKLLANRTKSKKYDEDLKNKLKNLEKAREKMLYTAGCIDFLKDTAAEASEIMEAFEDPAFSNIGVGTSKAKLKEASKILRQIKEFYEGYGGLVAAFTNVDDLVSEGVLNMEDKDAQNIASTALLLQKTLNRMETKYKEFRYNVVFAFLKEYWGEDKFITIGTKKGEMLTLKMILEEAGNDIGIVDRFLSSMSDASDPLLSLIDASVKDTQIERDAEIQEIMASIRAAHEELIASGNNTDFMYDRDENDVPTGYIISDIDFNKYNKARREYIQSLKDNGDDRHKIKNKLANWETRNTESIRYPSGKIERVPKKYYKNSKGETIPLYAGTPLERRLDEAQLKYYNTMMQLKMELDAYLPDSTTKLYRAVQIRNNTVEALANNITNPKEAYRILKDRLKDSFLVREDDVDFGEDKATKVQLDFAGNAVQRLPISYTRMIKDKTRLSTDFTSSMLAYTGMAVNYKKMSNVIDTLELARDLVKDRTVKQRSRGGFLEDSMNVMGRTYRKAYTTTGAHSRIGERIDDYYDSVIYGKRKNDEGTVGQSSVSKAKTADAVKGLTTTIGLGVNLFGGISNVVQGKLQMFYEGLGGEYFTLKNLVHGKSNYWAGLPEFLGELNSTQKSSKLGLLIDKYDALEDFYENLRDTDFYKSGFARILGKTNILFLNSMGEHLLHAQNMLAMLDAIKVLDKEGNEITMYDAYEVQTVNGKSSLVLKEGVKSLSGELISTTNLDSNSAGFKSAHTAFAKIIAEQKKKIAKVNQSMNGAFNETDKGAIHKQSLGRLAMQFRQWMPAHYSRRYASEYYDASLGVVREGYYYTVGRFLIETMHDLRRGELSLIKNFKLLTKAERANFKRAFSELGTWVLLLILCAAGGDEKDKNTWSERMAIYQLKRAKLETGASVPWFSLFENGFQILKSPAASINTIQSLIDCLKFPNMFVEIESGRYKGWSQYEKDLSQIIPVYSQIRRIIDLKSENYMFQMINN